MTVMKLAGALCWILESIFVAWYVYEGRNKTTRLSLVLKTICSLGVVAYAITLIQLAEQPGEWSHKFVFALGLSAFGDIVLGLVTYQNGGAAKDVIDAPKERRTFTVALTVCCGAAFICSYFLQMVVFLKGMKGDLPEYSVPFIILFLFPLILAVVGGVLAKFQIPDIPTRLFIIGVFYLLVLSALFASVSTYAIWYYQTEINHAMFIFSGSILLLLSGLVMSLRYGDAEKYDTMPMRCVSRVLYYSSWMILAGCAFLF